jgi:hypothetical protein
MSALTLELVHADTRELGSSVVLGLVLVDFVDWNGCVNDRWLDGLFLDDWLDVLVYMVVDMLACSNWIGRGGVLSLSNRAGILELSLLGSQSLLGVGVRTVLDVTVLYAGHLVGVLLGKNLAVSDRLDRGMIVVLVNLAVDSGSLIFMLCFGDVLVLNGSVDGLVHGSVMLSVLVQEVANCFLCLVHCDGGI